MATSLTDRLAEVETAITVILEGGQEAEIDGRKYKRADYGLLAKERERLEAQIANASAGVARNYAEFARRD